jgi:hypothetical protein
MDIDAAVVAIVGAALAAMTCWLQHSHRAPFSHGTKQVVQNPVHRVAARFEGSSFEGSSLLGSGLARSILTSRSRSARAAPHWGQKAPPKGTGLPQVLQNPPRSPTVGSRAGRCRVREGTLCAEGAAVLSTVAALRARGGSGGFSFFLGVGARLIGEVSVSGASVAHSSCTSCSKRVPLA